MDKDEMVKKAAEMLKQMYYEDVRFFCGMMEKFLQRKGGCSTSDS